MAFRKIDIDQYDLDKVEETELYTADPRDPQEILALAKTKTTTVRSLLQR